MELGQAQMKIAWDENLKKRVFKAGDLMMLYNFSHFQIADKRLQPKCFELYKVKEVFATNGINVLFNLDGTNYQDQINHDKLNKVYVDLLE